jgi:hypothetical protein
MKQIAVEWLAKELYEKFEMKGDGKVFDELLNQAKAMEKDQIKSSFNKGYSNGYSNGLMYIEGEDFHTFANSDANIYYNETFKPKQR